MTRMHLPPRPVNEGARRLAQWVLANFAGDLRAAAATIPGWAVSTFERLLAGEIVPGAEIAEPLERRAAIRHRTWRRPPAGGWFDAIEAQA